MATARTELQVDIQGLRDLQGRFASFLDRGLADIQLEEARKLARTAADSYKAYAPRSALGASRTGLHFRDSFSGSASITEDGFRVEVSTSQAQLAGWLREGTGIYGPAHHFITARDPAKMMGPIFNWFPRDTSTFRRGGAGPFWFRRIRGMRPNPWELEAEAEASALADGTASYIGVRIVDYFTSTKAAT